MNYNAGSAQSKQAIHIQKRFPDLEPPFHQSMESILPEDDYKYSSITPQRCVWDDSCESCPSAFLCNFQ